MGIVADYQPEETFGSLSEAFGSSSDDLWNSPIFQTGGSPMDQALRMGANELNMRSVLGDLGIEGGLPSFDQAFGGGPKPQPQQPRSQLPDDVYTLY